MGNIVFGIVGCGEGVTRESTNGESRGVLNCTVTVTVIRVLEYSRGIECSQSFKSTFCDNVSLSERCPSLSTLRACHHSKILAFKYVVYILARSTLEYRIELNDDYLGVGRLKGRIAKCRCQFPRDSLSAITFPSCVS